MAALHPATHAAPLRKRVGTRPPRGPKVALSPLPQDRADGDAWMAESSPAMTVEGRSAPDVDRTYTIARAACNWPYARFPPASPSLAMTAATSCSAEPPASTVMTPGSSGVGSSSVSNWLRKSEAGIYS